MKRIRREINVFNLAAIDLFASAMGAFMLISLVTIPYYLNTDFLNERIVELTAESGQIQSQTARARESLGQTQQQVQQQQRQLDELDEESRQQQEQLQNLQRRLSKNILAVMINWYTTADIDLHVVTPAGHHYSFKNHNRREVGGGRRPHWPDEEAELSFDAGAAITGKAGIEVWTMADAAPGEYRITVNKYASKGDNQPTRVEMAVLSGNRVERKTLEGLTGEKLAAVARVSADGQVTVEWR